MAGDDDHLALGRIVLVLHAGGLDHLILVDLSGDRLVHHQVTQDSQQLFGTDSAGTQQPGALISQVHDGGFHAHPAGAAVDDSGDFAVVVVEDMLGGGGGGLAGNIGGGGGDGDAGLADDLPGHIAVGAADAHGDQTAGGAAGHIGPGGQHHGQGAGPEGLGQGIGCHGDMVAEFLDLRQLGDMEDQGVVLGTALGLEDSGNSLFVQAVGAQTVDGLRGDGHQTAVFNDFSCRFHSTGSSSGEK